MRRTKWIALLLLALTGCPAAHEAYPSTSCKKDSDCYLGEHCDITSFFCVTIPTDMAVSLPPADLATSSSDMPPDGGP